MKAYFRKVPGGALIPDDGAGVAALSRIKLGNVVLVEFREPRNYRFHKKFFAMLDVGFESWEPAGDQEEYRGLPVVKSREKFRKNCIIAAGFYTAHYTLDGGVDLEAQSIAFANMEEDEFAQLYSNVADVLLQKVLRNYSRADLDTVVERILGFT